MSMMTEMGDLADIPHEDLIAIINNTLGKHLESRDGSLEHDYQAREKALLQGIERQRDKLTERHVVHALQEVAMKYRLADTLPFTSPLEHMAHRLSQFSDTHVVSDFDCSMTFEKNNTERNYLMPNVPGSVHLEQHFLDHGRDNFARPFIEHIQPHLKSHPHLFYEGGRNAVILRKGVVEFFADLAKRGSKRTILSANFKPFIEGGLSKTPLKHDKDLRIIAITHDDISSKDKDTALKLLAAENPNHAIIYIGDGASDMKAVDAFRHYAIAGIFALRGSDFDKELTAKGIPHLVYSDFHEIGIQLQQAQYLAQQLRKRAA